VKPKPERRADVLNAMADYLLGNGLADATLRRAASKLGTSARMLLLILFAPSSSEYCVWRCRWTKDIAPVPGPLLNVPSSWVARAR
jgi:hypothetical protein